MNLFWAFGLANKNPILETGEMMDPEYGGAGNFALLVVGRFPKEIQWIIIVIITSCFDLTPEQQALVDKISRGVYRPCCGNP